jgi:hypothetical protein
VLSCINTIKTTTKYNINHLTTDRTDHPINRARAPGPHQRASENKNRSPRVNKRHQHGSCAHNTAGPWCRISASSTLRLFATRHHCGNLHPPHVTRFPDSSAHPRAALCFLLLPWSLHTLGYIGRWPGS